MMTKSRYLQITIAALVVLALFAPPAAAQTTDGEETSPLDTLLGVDDNASTVDQAAAVANGVLGFVDGRVDAFTDSVASLVGASDPPAADTAATDVQQFVNDRSSEFVTYANGRLPASNQTDVLEITYETDEDTATHYVVVEHNGTEWTSLTIVNSTSKTVDNECNLSDDAAEDAPSVLETAYDRYISTDESPDAQYIGRLTGRYTNDVNCSFGVTS